MVIIGDDDDDDGLCDADANDDCDDYVRYDGDG
jgi:hypothetical protein